MYVCSTVTCYIFNYILTDMYYSTISLHYICTYMFLFLIYAVQNVFSPLHLAAQMGHTELVELLILSGGNFNCVTKVCLTL